MAYSIAALNLVMSSREIAKLTSKRHADVMRDIRVMLAHIEETTPDAFLPEKLSNKQQGANLRSGISAVQYGTNNAGLPVYEYHLDKNHTLTLLTGYDAKARFKVIQRWQELEAQQTATASPPFSPPATVLFPPSSVTPLIERVCAKGELLKTSVHILKPSQPSILRMLHELGASEGLDTGFLPAYSEESVVQSLTTLLKQHHSRYSARAVNRVLLDMGILEELTRPSRSGNKRFKHLTEAGLRYGRNETSAQNPRETQPLYYVEHFPELLARIETVLGQKAA